MRYTAKHQITSVLFLAALLASSALQAATVTVAPQHAHQVVTPTPRGPFHVVGNQIIDSKARPFLLRGTQLREFRLETATYDSHSAVDFGPYSATSLSAIRLRFNMNTVRIPVNVRDGSGTAYFSELGKVVRRANDLDLLVVLAAKESGAGPAMKTTAAFWSNCAGFFKDYPNVMFDVFSDPAARDTAGKRDLVQAIRSAGATQPVLVVNGPELLEDSNIVYEVAPRYASSRTDPERDTYFGALAQRVPMIATGLDLNLDDAAECAVLPSDPTAAARLVEANLDYFDANRISWTISVFEPGKLVKDLSLHDATSLENGWSCGHPVYPYAGLGRVVEGHLRSSEERGLFVVSGSGGMEIGRGAFALAYGPIMAERDSQHKAGSIAPTSLGGLSVQITDAAGISRPAGILWATAGWGQLNFVIPSESALGPARMTIVRKDGSSTSANITIAETAPGFVTGHSCRGPAIGSATRLISGGGKTTTALSSCKGSDCKTLSIPVTAGAATRVRIAGSGLRNAGSTANIQVTIGGVRVPVVAFGPSGNPGEDTLTIEIPPSMRGLGEADLICRVGGRVSNAVLVRIGGGQPVS